MDHWRSRNRTAGWGSFPRILGKYVREEHLLTLEEAVRKMTAQPAGRVHLRDRGLLRPGMAADVTIFDPATINDVGTFKDPNHYAITLVQDRFLQSEIKEVPSYN